MKDKIQYKLEEDGKSICAYIDEQKIGEVTFVTSGDNTLIIDYTGVNKSANGKGIGTELVKQVAKMARDENKVIIPLCPFAKAVFDKTPEISDTRK